MDYQELGLGTRKTNVPVQLAKASNFDHDSPFSIETAQVGRIEGYVLPTGGVTDSGPYTMEIPTQEETYLMMNTLGLYVKGQVLRANGNVMDPADVVAPLNCLGTTMWENVEVGSLPFINS